MLNPFTYSLVSAADDDALGGALDGVGGEESQVLGLQRVLVCEVGAARLRFRLARQARVVHFEAARLDYPDVRWDSVAEFHLQKHNV